MTNCDDLVPFAILLIVQFGKIIPFIPSWRLLK